MAAAGAVRRQHGAGRTKRGVKSVIGLIGANLICGTAILLTRSVTAGTVTRWYREAIDYYQ
jgi:hypothetical protein